jgi:hypothetical protein
LTNRARSILASLAALAALAASLHGAAPTFWQVSTQSDLLRGDVTNLSIDQHGRLVLGPAAVLHYESTAPFLWVLLPASDGSVYVGSGNEGKVFKVDDSGKGRMFFDATELEVHALANAPDGGLYVGTSPDGKIYKVSASGTSNVFFDPEDKYIWALAVDASGTVYAAAGEKGVIYRITPDGKGTPLYRTNTTHVVSLAFDQAGNLLAGTESPGKLFRFDKDGKPFVMLDSTFTEIHAIRVDPKGVIYATAVSGRPVAGDDRPTLDRPPTESPRTSGAPVPTVTTEITSMSIADVSVSAGSQTTSTSGRSDPRSPKGAVYRVSPDGPWDVVWESRDDSPYDVVFEGDGSVLVGTGPHGKLFRIQSDQVRPALLTRAEAQQVTAMTRDAKGRIILATANPGKLFRLSGDHAAEGTYESEVKDAKTVATWGTISWRASTPPGSRVQVFTRSGNSGTPDDTWSAWAGPYGDAGGSPITSPKARYLQWKAVLAGKDNGPILTSVTAAFLQRNIRPEVTSITIHPPGVVFQKPFSTGELEIAGYDDTAPDRKPLANTQSATATGSSVSSPTLGRRAYQKGLQTLVWKAEDENDDDLQYDVLYRREGETTWKALKRGLNDAIYVWDTTSVPNGTYFIKIVASDTPANPPGTALTGELESTSFDIDNTPPVITVTSVRREGAKTIFAFEVRDDQSTLQRVEYSLDADRWRAIYPKDGIADSRVEQYELTLEGEAANRGVIFRAVDAMNNASTARGEVKK